MKKTQKRTLASNFAAALKARRVSSGRPQESLAQAAKLSVSYISMLERGTRTPPLNTVEQLAAALQVEPLELLREAA